MPVSPALLENMIRHCEIKRDNALDFIADHNAGIERDGFDISLGEIEVSYWTDMFEALNELKNFRVRAGWTTKMPWERKE